MGCLPWWGAILIALTIMLFGIFLSLQAALIFPYLAEQAPQLLAAPPPSFFALFIVGTAVGTIGPILLAIPMLRRRVPTAWIGWVLVLSGVFSLVSFFTSAPGTPPSLLLSLVNSASPLLGAIGLGGLGILLLRQPDGSAAATP
jgi:hypothetical protein